MHQVLERHQHKVALADQRMRQAQLFAAVDLAVHPQQVQVDGARAVDLGLLGAVAPQLGLDLHKLVKQHQRRQLGLDLDDGVGKCVLACLVGRLALVDARAVGHAGERNLGDHVACGADVVATMPQIGAHGHKRTARLRFGDSPVTVQELRKAGNVVHAHDVGTGLDSAQAYAKRGGIARGGIGHARDGAHKTLARHGTHERVAQRRHLGGLALDDDILVGCLAKARAGIDADAVARHAGMDECAGLVGQKAHDAAHDGRRIGQGEAAELRGRHVGLLAAGAAAHHGRQVIIGLRRGLRGRGGLGDRGGLFGGRRLLLLLVRGLRRRLRIAKRQRGLHHASRKLGFRLGLAQQLATAATSGLLGLARGLSSRLARLLGNKRRGRGIELHRRVRTSGSGDLAGVHHDNAAGARLNKLDHLGVGESRHVVDDRGAAAHGRLSNRHVARVD